MTLPKRPVHPEAALFLHGGRPHLAVELLRFGPAPILLRQVSRMAPIEMASIAFALALIGILLGRLTQKRFPKPISALNPRRSSS
jgi:hypothetical protein